jgi:hypothetical protein
MTTHSSTPSPPRRTASCPSLPALREALLHEDWSQIDRRHVDSCAFCNRNLSQAAAHLWHASLSAICRRSRDDLPPQDRRETEFHLHEDHCASCCELENLWRQSDELQALAAEAAEKEQHASPLVADAWREFALAALAAHPKSAALRDRLTALIHGAEHAVAGEKPSLVEHVERLLAKLARGDELARDSLVALAWSRIVSLGQRMRGPLAIDPDVVNAAGVRLRRALSIAPRTAREFFHVAAQQIRQELLALSHGPDLSGQETQNALADATTIETDQPARWRELCLHMESGALSEDEQEVVELLWLHGLSADEAAALVGAEPRAVRRRWRSALLSLHNSLEGPESSG